MCVCVDQNAHELPRNSPDAKVIGSCRNPILRWTQRIHNNQPSTLFLYPKRPHHPLRKKKDIYTPENVKPPRTKVNGQVGENINESTPVVLIFWMWVVYVDHSKLLGCCCEYLGQKVQYMTKLVSPFRDRAGFMLSAFLSWLVNQYKLKRTN